MLLGQEVFSHLFCLKGGRDKKFQVFRWHGDMLFGLFLHFQCILTCIDLPTFPHWFTHIECKYVRAMYLSLHSLHRNIFAPYTCSTLTMFGSNKFRRRFLSKSPQPLTVLELAFRFIPDYIISRKTHKSFGFPGFFCHLLYMYIYILYIFQKNM